MKKIKLKNGSEQTLDNTIISYLKNKLEISQIAELYKILVECNIEIEKTRTRKELDTFFKDK